MKKKKEDLLIWATMILLSPFIFVRMIGAIIGTCIAIICTIPAVLVCGSFGIIKMIKNGKKMDLYYIKSAYDKFMRCWIDDFRDRIL